MMVSFLALIIPTLLNAGDQEGFSSMRISLWLPHSFYLCKHVATCMRGANESVCYAFYSLCVSLSCSAEMAKTWNAALNPDAVS